MKKAIVPLGIILLVVFGVFMYLNRFVVFHVSDVDGYVFNTNNIAANLSAGMTENSEKVTYENLKINEKIITLLCCGRNDGIVQPTCKTSRNSSSSTM